MKQIAYRWMVGAVVAFLWLCPHLRMYTDQSTRYYAFWTRRDALALALIVVLSASILTLGITLMRRLRCGWLDRAVNAAFVCAVGWAVVAVVRTGAVGNGQWLEGLLLAVTGVAIALAGLSLIPGLAQIQRFFKVFCLLISPVVPLVMGQLLSYPEFAQTPDTSWSRATSAPVPDSTVLQSTAGIYIFIFDEWSYTRTFARDDFNVEFPNLAKLVRTATLYHDAHSPHRSTSQSLPGILFQTNDEFVFHGGAPRFIRGEGRFQPTPTADNLFLLADRAGLRTFLVGWYHPYRHMFGQELDFCWSAPSSVNTARSCTLLRRMAEHLRLGLSRTSVAIPKPASIQWRVERLCTRSERDYAVETTRRIHDLALRIIRGTGDPCLAVFHYAVPHWPFVYERQGVNADAANENPLHFGTAPDGRRVPPDADRYVARYAGNLRYVDTLTGELIAGLESAGKLASSTVVLTSDHSWRGDPRLNDEPSMNELTHVPLIIKHAHQTVRQEVDTAFFLIDLARVLPLQKGAAYAAGR